MVADTTFGRTMRTIDFASRCRIVYIVFFERFLVDWRQATNVGALQTVPCNRRIGSVTLSTNPRSEHVRCAVGASQLVVQLPQQTVETVFEFVQLQAVLLVESSLVQVLVVEGYTVDGQDSLEDPFRRSTAKELKKSVLNLQTFFCF